MLVSVAAPNRDERYFLTPATFDPDRAANSHLACGHGTHYYLGTGPARFDPRIALTGPVRRCPLLRPADARTCGDVRAS
ncbi:hypothetical protein [Nocardia sp. R6R-6]|uniref:hypothetical protein n=1 Tax=Nocardia sp. R6R-6 TaxID=3459303 RepID=UPI00403D95C5